MDDAAIDVEGLGKRYLLGETTAPTDLLSESLTALLKRRRLRSTEEFWALRDVSFSVRRGEALGVIGRNGAGKSTLLKILTRITEPTEGRATIAGRAGSLLEVGTGFHPELTGRENIFLNGAILGMGRTEIRRKMDEIVEFAGIERFIETPVKRYSSGMYMRLAFSVAAHLESEILLVDEVLAVGDAQFQQRCLGKMSDVTREGRTVLFVSHSMNAVTALCDRCLWLEGGHVKVVDEARRVVRDYLTEQGGERASQTFEVDPTRPAQIVRVAVGSGAGGGPRSELLADEPFEITMSFDVRQHVPGLYAAVHLRTLEGVIALFSDSRDEGGVDLSDGPGGRRSFRVEVPGRVLAPGDYVVTVGLASPYGGQVDRREAACSVRLSDPTSHRGDNRPGIVGIFLRWKPTDDG